MLYPKSIDFAALIFVVRGQHLKVFSAHILTISSQEPKLHVVNKVLKYIHVLYQENASLLDPLE